jgi:hypothetical protein
MWRRAEILNGSPNKAFVVMPGVAHASYQQKNYMLVYHTLLSFFAQPDLVYTGA